MLRPFDKLTAQHERNEAPRPQGGACGAFAGHIIGTRRRSPRARRRETAGLGNTPNVVTRRILSTGGFTDGNTTMV